MKKFKFNLESVLRYKENVEDYEKGILAYMNGRLSELTGELGLIKAKYAEETAEFEAASMNGIKIHDARYRQAVIEGLLESAERKSLEIEEQRRLIAEQTEVVIEAVREKKSIEKLKEKKRGEYNAALSKENELLIEEFVSNRSGGTVS